jgi:cytochrome c biogenesis protein CcdA
VTPKIFPFLILLALYVLVGVASGGSKIVIEYFYYDPSKLPCPACDDPKIAMIEDLMSEIEREYADQVYVERLDVSSEPGASRWRNYGSPQVPALVINYTFCMKKEEITAESLKGILDAYLSGSPVPKKVCASEDFPILLLVVLSGLIDGINPCAIALLTFFLAFLYSINRTRRDVMKIAATYIIGLYVVYLSIGLGLLHSVEFFGIARPFSIIGVTALVFYGLINIKDSLWPGKYSLKFPKKALPTVKRLLERASMPAALAMGVLVGLLEFPCTGGIYVFILSLLGGETFLNGFAYLLIYNLMFIVPLLIILLIGSNIESVTKMDRWRQQRRHQIRLITGIIMVFLGLLVIYLIVAKQI